MKVEPKNANLMEFEIIENLEKVELISAVPGTTDADVSIKVDTETNEVFINIKESCTLADSVKKLIDTSKNGKVNIDKKYNVNSAKYKITDGLLHITIPVNDGRILTINSK